MKISGFQDYLIEKFFGGGHDGYTDVVPTTSVKSRYIRDARSDCSNHPSNTGKQASNLKIFTSWSSGNRNNYRKRIGSFDGSTGRSYSDWLKNAQTVAPAEKFPAPIATPAIEASPVSEIEDTPKEDIPDWLKGRNAFTGCSIKKNDIPDWLKGMDEQALSEEVEETLSEPVKDMTALETAPVKRRGWGSDHADRRAPRLVLLRKISPRLLSKKIQLLPLLKNPSSKHKRLSCQNGFEQSKLILTMLLQKKISRR